MKSLQELRNEFRNSLGQHESEILYGVLPILGHPKLLETIRHTSAWMSRREQQIEHIQAVLVRRCKLAHQEDYVRVQVLREEIEELLHKVDCTRGVSGDEDHPEV